MLHTQSLPHLVRLQINHTSSSSLPHQTQVTTALRIHSSRRFLPVNSSFSPVRNKAMRIPIFSRLPREAPGNSTNPNQSSRTDQMELLSMARLEGLHNFPPTSAIPSLHQDHTRQVCTPASRKATSRTLHRHMRTSRPHLRLASCYHHSRSTLKTLLEFITLQRRPRNILKCLPLSTNGRPRSSNITHPLPTGLVRLCIRL